MDRRHAARVDPASVTDPLLVVAAGQDRATPAAVVRKVAKRYGSYATYHEFEEQAHWVLAQKGWEEVAGFVENWLQS